MEWSGVKIFKENVVWSVEKLSGCATFWSGVAISAFGGKLWQFVSRQDAAYIFYHLAAKDPVEHNWLDMSLVSPLALCWLIHHLWWVNRLVMSHENRAFLQLLYPYFHRLFLKKFWEFFLLWSGILLGHVNLQHGRNWLVPIITSISSKGWVYSNLELTLIPLQDRPTKFT